MLEINLYQRYPTRYSKKADVKDIGNVIDKTIRNDIDPKPGVDH